MVKRIEPSLEEILDFEQYWWKKASVKDDAIRERFGIEPEVYYATAKATINERLEEARTINDMVVRRFLRRGGQLK